MPPTIAPTVWQKPTGNVRLNRRHPLAARVKFCVPLTEIGSKTVRELVTGATATLGAGATWTESPYGPALSFNGTTGAISSFSAVPSVPSGNVSVFMVAFATSIVNGMRPFSLPDATGSSLTIVDLVPGTANALYACGGTNYLCGTPLASPAGFWYTQTANPSTGSDLFITNGTFQPESSMAASGTTTGFQIGGGNAVAPWSGMLAFLIGFYPRLTVADELLLNWRSFDLIEPASPVRRFAVLVPPTGATQPTGALGWTAGPATWALAGVEQARGALGFQAGPATWALGADAGTAGTAGFVAGPATWALGGNVGAAGALGFQAGPATWAVAGVEQPRASVGFVAGAATWALGGAATGGGPATTAGLTWNADTFTLALDGTLGWTAGPAAWTLGGATTAGTLGFKAGPATWAIGGTATPPAPPAPVAALGWLAGAATWALAGRYALAGGLTWKAGSANAPLLHTPAPAQAPAPPPWLPSAVKLDAQRRRADGAGVVTLVPRPAAGAAFPAQPQSGVSATVTLRRYGGGPPVDLPGLVRDVRDPRTGAPCCGVEVAWPPALPWNGYYVAALTLRGPSGVQRCPERGMAPVLLVASDG